MFILASLNTPWLLTLTFKTKVSLSDIFACFSYLLPSSVFRYASYFTFFILVSSLCNSNAFAIVSPKITMCAESNKIIKLKIVIFPGQSKTYEIPATVSDISVILNDYLLDFTDPGFVRYNNAAYNLESVTADGLNSFYKAVDGVLYNKDMTEVILYPQNVKVHMLCQQALRILTQQYLQMRKD